jgi:hypothetical protein
MAEDLGLRMGPPDPVSVFPVGSFKFRVTAPGYDVALSVTCEEDIDTLQRLLNKARLSLPTEGKS